MKRIALNAEYLKDFLTQQDMVDFIHSNEKNIKAAIEGESQYINDIGWHSTEKWGISQIASMKASAKRVHDKADVFVLIGIGGSNQGARAAIKAIMPKSETEVVYAGNNLSGAALNRLIKELEGKSVYLDCIAKNFATLEPGICFRVLRQYMEKRYGKEEAAKRITVTCSMNDSSLQRLGEIKGYETMPFPLDIGGRYSVLSPVGLFPMAVAGIDIEEMLRGAAEMEQYIKTAPLEENDAVLYAAARNLLYKKGSKIEILSCFEPAMEYFAKWWTQLYGESEGKEKKGLYPSACNFSEDLHSMGQYIQDGQRILMETFLNITEEQDNLKIAPDGDDLDGFAYLDNKDFNILNKTAYNATIAAHAAGGVPCMSLDIPKINAYYFGQLFYFFEIACYISGKLLGINPFNQEGVEEYKLKMFAGLGK